MSFKIADAYVEITAKENVDAGKRAAESKLNALRDKKVSIDADTKLAEVRIRQITAKLDALRSKKVTPQVEVQTAAAEARLAQLNAKLSSLRDKRLKVDVDASRAAAGLTRVDSAASKADASVSRLGSRRLPDISLRLAAGLAGIPALAGAAAAAIAAIPAAGASLGLVGGVLAGSFSGIGDALKGLTADQNRAASGGGGNSAANAARSSARAIRDATQQINDAKRDQARVAIDTAEQIANAERSVQDAARATARAEQALTDAKRDAARTARDSAQQVVDAEQAVSDAERSAARSARDSARAVEQAAEQVTAAKLDEQRSAERAADSVASAARRVQQALRTETDAQKALTDARADATRQLADLQERVSDLALDEEGATLAVQRAQENLTKVNNDALATDLDKAEAAHELRVAQERLSDVQRDQVDAAKENNQAQVKGVEGADKVVDAKLRLEDATTATADAEHAYQEAQQDAAQSAIDATKRVSDAEEALATARQNQADAAIDAQERVQNAVENLSQARTRAFEANADAAERVQQAEDGVSDAMRAQEDAARSLASTRRHAADAQADAAERVRDAELGLKDAQEDANAAMAVGGAAAVSKFEQAMAKLSPLQRDLVRELLHWKDIMKELGRTASDAFLPGFIQMLKDAEGLQGIFNSALQRTGTIMGDTARKMGELFKSEVFKKDLDALLKSADPITKSIGNLFVDMTGRLVKFGAQMAPAADGFASFIDSMSKGLQGFFDELAPHSDSFKRIWEALGRIMEQLLPIIGRLVGQLADALVPILESLAGWLERNQDSIKTWVDRIAAAAPYVGALVLAVKGLSVLQKVIGWGSGIAKMFDEIGSSADRNAPKVRKMGGAGKFGKVAKGAGIVAGLGVGVLAADAALPDQAGAPGSLGQHNRDELKAMADAIKDPSSALEKMKADFAAFPGEFRNSPFMRFFRDELPAWWNGLWGSNGSIATTVEGVKTWMGAKFTEVKDGAVGKLTEWKDRSVEKAGELKTGIENFITGIPGWIRDRFTEFKDWALGKLDEWKVGGLQKVTDFKTGTEGFITGIPGWVRDRFNEFKLWAHQKLDEWKTGGLQKILDFKTGAQNSILGIPGWVRDRFNEFKDWAIQKLTEWKTTGLQRVTEFKTGIENFIKGIPGWVRDRFNELKDWALAKLTEWKTTGTQRAREVVDGIMGWIKDLPGKVQTAFFNMKEWALRELGALRDKASEPIRFVVDTVYDHGIKPMWNSIAGVFNLPRLATGGILPGYTPGRDVHLAALSGGEAVMRPEWTRAAGPDYIHGANAAARLGGVGGAQQFIAQNGLPGYALGGIVDSLFTGGANAVRGLFGAALGDNNRTPGQASNWRTAAMQPAPRAVDGAVAAVKKALDSMLSAVGVGGGGGAQRWSPVVLQALAMMGQPASLLGVVLRRMNQESGGNPLAINNWDSNAARGTPSKGLMQVIDPTFRAYHFPGTSNSPYDPLANILASMRYAMARYGSLAAAYNRAGGYDEGGIATGVGMLPKRTARPERVLSPRQTESFEQLVASLDSRPAGGGVTIQELHVNVTGVLDFRQRDVATRQVVTDLITAIDAVKRSNS